MTSALEGGEWSVSRPGRFTPGKKPPGTHWLGGWVAPRAGLDAVEKRKIPSLLRESNPPIPIVHPVASRYTDWATAAQIII
jgi:4-amino-4-deoxy-L-arabinose transferase-like glycosyltransferase